MKTYTVRTLTNEPGKDTVVELGLEFEGSRAFAIWDSISVGKYELKARLELNAKLLRKVTVQGCDFFYLGQISLPRPEHN